MANYAEYKLIEQAKEELKKAFQSNAALRHTKVELEERLKKLRQRLLENKEVDAILENPKYKKLEILREKGFLSDIEKKVAEEYAASLRRSARREKIGTKQKKQRTTPEEKQNLLIEFVKAHKGKQFLLSDVTDWMEQQTGRDIQIKSWLTPLNLPKAAQKRVSALRKDGTWFRPLHVQFLKPHVVLEDGETADADESDADEETSTTDA